MQQNRVPRLVFINIGLLRLVEGRINKACLFLLPIIISWILCVLAHVYMMACCIYVDEHKRGNLTQTMLQGLTANWENVGSQ